MQQKVAIATICSILIMLPSGAVGQSYSKSTMTFLPWEIIDGDTLYVVLQSDSSISTKDLETVKNTIMSENSVSINGKMLYEGWMGALKKASDHKTKLAMPTTIKIVESAPTAKVITIFLTTSDETGHSGYTKVTVNHDKIISSKITIYHVDKLTNEELATVVRHEFGHALGLGHSTYGDMMHEIIDSNFSFISECNVQALRSLYDGNTFSEHFEENSL